MPRDNVSQWETNQASNVDIAGVNIGEFCPASGINNAIRTLMAQIAAAFGTVAEIWAAAAYKFTTPSTLFAASEPQTVVDAAAITLNGNAGWSFNIAANSAIASRQINNPANFKKGQSGRIRYSNASATTLTLIFGPAWMVSGGKTTTIPPTSFITIGYFVNDTADIEANIARGYL